MTTRIWILTVTFAIAADGCARQPHTYAAGTALAFHLKGELCENTAAVGQLATASAMTTAQLNGLGGPGLPDGSTAQLEVATFRHGTRQTGTWFITLDVQSLTIQGQTYRLTGVTAAPEPESVAYTVDRGICIRSGGELDSRLRDSLTLSAPHS